MSLSLKTNTPKIHKILIGISFIALLASGCGKDEANKEREIDENNNSSKNFLIGDQFNEEGKVICHYEDDKHQPKSFSLAGRARGYTFSFQRGGKMHGITSAKTLRRFKEGLGELEAVAGLKFYHMSVNTKFKISFWHQNQMKYGALGLAYLRSGDIFINNSRNVGLTNPGNRVAQGLIMHEMMHHLGFSHNSSNRSCVMHPWGGTQLCSSEIATLQRKFGPSIEVEQKRLKALRTQYQNRINVHNAGIDTLKTEKADYQGQYIEVLRRISENSIEYKESRKDRSPEGREKSNQLRIQKSELMKLRNTLRKKYRSFDRDIRKIQSKIKKINTAISKINRLIY